MNQQGGGPHRKRGDKPIVIHRDKTFEVTRENGTVDEYRLEPIFNEDHVSRAGNARMDGYEIVWTSPPHGAVVITVIPYRTIAHAREQINSGRDFR